MPETGDEILPKEALAYLREKKLKPGFSYRDVWLEEHAYNFTVAKAMQIDLLADLKEAVDTAIEEGQTLGQFRRELEPVLADYKWWGKRTMTDPKTGKQVKAQLGSARRLEVIYDTNMRQAYNAGRWARGQNSAAHTHILYLVGPSINHRKQHLEWNGLVLPKDDPFWTRHAPMNGWGCKCYVQFLTRQRVEKLRREGIPDAENIRNGRAVGRVPIKETAPAEKMRSYVNKRTGKTHTVPEGIDPGFEWNPGEARAKALSKALVQRRNRFDLAFPPAPPQGFPVSAAIRSVAKAYAEPVQRAMKAINSVHGTSTLPKIPIRSGNAGDYLGLFAADTRGPVAIRLTGGDHAALTVIHEIGHFLDFAGLPGEGASSRNPKGKLRRVMRAIRKSPEVKAIKAIAGVNQGYNLDPAELFARAYTQYIVGRSGETFLLLQLKGLTLNATLPEDEYKQWSDENFLPIEAAFERLFKGLKWQKGS